MKNLFGAAVCMVVAVSLAGCAGMTKQDVGTLSGAAVGGLVGSRFGGGSGQVVAGVAGAVIGGVLGGQVGKSMDKTDRLETQQALARSRTKHTTRWRNPDTGARYAVTPTKTYKRTNGQYCREYTTTAVIAGKKQKMYGTACRQPDGSWKEISRK